METTLPISRALLSLLSKANLDPEQMMFYVAAKLQIMLGEQPTIESTCALLGGKGRGAAARLKDAGLIPKGRLDLDHLDAILMKVAEGGRMPVHTDTISDEVVQKAKVAVAALKTGMQRVNPSFRFPDMRMWWGRQQTFAVAQLRRGASFDDLMACITWIFEERWAAEYLAPNCDSMAKVFQYWPKWQLRAGAKRTSTAVSRNEHDEIWSTGT